MYYEGKSISRLSRVAYLIEELANRIEMTDKTIKIISELTSLVPYRICRATYNFIFRTAEPARMLAYDQYMEKIHNAWKQSGLATKFGDIKGSEEGHYYFIKWHGKRRYLIVGHLCKYHDITGGFKTLTDKTAEKSIENDRISLSDIPWPYRADKSVVKFFGTPEEREEWLKIHPGENFQEWRWEPMDLD